jgi:hypothetical protein
MLMDNELVPGRKPLEQVNGTIRVLKPEIFGVCLFTVGNADQLP